MRIFLILLTLSGLIFIGDKVGVLGPVRTAATVVTVPVQGALYSVQQSTFDLFSFLTFWKSGEARIKNLELRLAEAGSQQARADALAKENADLRAQLGAPASLGKKLLPAPVLGQGRYLEIGVGAGDKVAVGQTVVYLNYLIGRVAKISGRESFVALPTDSDSKVPVVIGTAHGLVIGQFNSSAIITQIAQNENLQSGDTIMTSGEGGTYRPGLIVGQVGEIKNDSTALFKQASVTFPLDFERLGTVFISY